MSEVIEHLDQLPITIVGERTLVFTQYTDGLCVVKSEKFKPISPEVSTLRHIWTPGQESKFDLFISEAIRNGLIDEHTMQWLHGSVSLKCCYYFLSSVSVGLVKANLRWTQVYRAFSGTFTLTKIKHARSLQDRSNKTQAYRNTEKKWENFFKETFSLNG
jgi:hypothetical protein